MTSGRSQSLDWCKLCGHIWACFYDSPETCPECNGIDEDGGRIESLLEKVPDEVFLIWDEEEL